MKYKYTVPLTKKSENLKKKEYTYYCPTLYN